jgi:hypothetical protein
MSSRTILAAATLSLAWVVTMGTSALASESACYSIRDADRKNMCLARARNQESYCYSIRHSDDKHMCLAVVKKRRSDCYSIRSNDQKNMCLAQVR